MTLGLSRRAILSLVALAPLALAGRGRAGDPKVHDVVMKGLTFVPATTQVHVGDMLRWTNADIAPHTATADDQTWNTGPLKKGESAMIEVTKGMTAAYGCEFHPHMMGRLSVIF